MQIKILKILILVVIFLGTIKNTALGTEEIIESQMKDLNISSFIELGEKYTKETFDGINIKELLSDAISGEVDNKSIYKKILGIFR